MVAKKIKNGVSIVNIIIVIGLISLAYLSYTQYIDERLRKDLAGAPQDNINRPAEPAAEKNNLAPTAEKSAQISVPPAPAKATPPEKKETAPAAKPGYYRNNTYNYEIKFPQDWPIKIRSEAEVSLGTMPPKNGQGAITIEVAQGETADEISQAKAEAAKYPGLVSLDEEPITLAGIAGTKISLTNFMAKTKNVFILLIKSGRNYIIKYSEESAEFTNQAEQALTAFKFTAPE